MLLIERFAELDSTNAEVLRRAEAGAPDGLWVMADRQTAGRGRRNRPWVSATGNLFCTRLVRPARDEPPAAQLSLVAGLAVHSAVSTFVPAVALKWPNDLVVTGPGGLRKLSGILLEAQGRAGALAIAVGIGINVAHHPDDVERPATSLAALAETVPTPFRLLEALVPAFEHWRQLWRAEGFAPIRTAWLDRCIGLGAPVTVRLSGSERHGTFDGLESDGALRLRLDSGAVEAIHAGDVFGI